MEVAMRGSLVWIVVAVMVGFAGPSLALEGGFDCAEGADEDLATESQTIEPAAPSTTPTS